MAFDGIAVAGITKELNDKLKGGRIVKIQQPERDELVLTVKNYDQFLLTISASAGMPLIYIADNKKEAPLAAPNFCMLLRKYLNSARILEITQPGLERVVCIKIEHLDELGDVKVKYIYTELMGKHSNIILVSDDEQPVIVDSIKHVSGMVSSVREVLPGREYFIPNLSDKLDPLNVTEEEFTASVLSQPAPVGKALYMKLTGLSPVFASELLYRAGIEPETDCSLIKGDIAAHLYKVVMRAMEEVKSGSFTPCIIYKDGEPFDFSVLELSMFKEPLYTVKSFESMSEVLRNFYSAKDSKSRILQKSADLRKLVGICMERAVKKYGLQCKQLKDTENREKYKVYGELLTAFGYNALEGAKSLRVNNYYTGEDMDIPLDPSMTAIENAKKYFDKYSKQKRTYEALCTYMEESRNEVEHLDSIKTALDIAVKEDDLQQIKDELVEFGYIKKHRNFAERNGKAIGKGKAQKNRKVKNNSRPFHYVTEDGYHIYIGKNNFQNDELTFKFAAGNDWWFHSKGMPGSHVIVKNPGTGELPDKVYEIAAGLAAFYSKGRENDKVEIDYLMKKNVKKPNGAKPGFVVYYTNYSMMAAPDASLVTLLEE